jgi:drug/metabolite transporter superfamily protein YnfA
MPLSAINRCWFWAAVVLTATKLWLTDGQTIYAIGPALHDDQLFVSLAAHILNGDWLGPYNQFTLAKGPIFPLFIAGVFWLGLPLILAQQLFYAGACALVARALRPWVQNAAAQFFIYASLLLNPMSYDAGNLGRLMRQNIYTPLGLIVIAGLVQLFARRRETWRQQAGPALLAGFALGCFWLTREESVWLLPTVMLLLLGGLASLCRELAVHGRKLAFSGGLMLAAALLPLLVVSALNHRHYGWFGTVEFRAAEFKGAYGALTRLQVGPELLQVPVTRQMREAAYELSPAFALLKPHLEGEIGNHWIERRLFPGEERQIRGGWFMWAIRDAMVAAGLAPNARTALQHYGRIADEINAACDAGIVPARPRRSGFVPPLGKADLVPLRDGALEYGAFFLFFRGFTAWAPDSVGDYAELKPFRDLVGNRLSHAPRSPDPLPPNQQVLAHAKVGWLETLGLKIGRLLAWLGPLVLLLGLFRSVEALIRRRATFLLGLAGALLAGCAAYLAINVLVHVTSFHNMSPAAMASAYPLYLLALAALTADAWRTWTAPDLPPVRERAGPPSRWRRLAPLGAALIVLSARLGFVFHYGSDVPYNDQWYIEARQILEPWLNGILRPWDFFLPHFEHVPVWTRFLSLLQVVVTGRWDPLVQMTVNATLHASFVWLVGVWAWRDFRPLAALVVGLVLVLGGALPHAWENIAWGFQSQFPLALLFLFVHVQASCYYAVGTRGWWWAQVVAFAGLFTLASMWLAPLAVVASWCWTGFRKWRDHRVPLIVAATGATMLLIIHWHQAGGGSFSQIVSSPLGLLHSALHLLGWPSLLPGAAAVVQLPWIIHALRLRNLADTAPADRMIFVLGLWNLLQAVALSAARTGDSNDFVSRYGDLLFIGVLAGTLALIRLIPSHGPSRAVFLGLAVLWGALVGAGLLRNSTEGHAHYFHLHAAQNAEFRRGALQDYMESGDRVRLDSTQARWVLCPDSDLVASLLDQPAFRGLLPATVNPRSAGDPAGTFVRKLHGQWAVLLAGGFGLFVVGAVFTMLRGTEQKAPRPPPAWDSPWLVRLSAGVAIAAMACTFIWAGPFALDREKRWERVFGSQAVSGLVFDFVTPSEFGPERLQGAAPLLPEILRNQFYGTAPQGPGFTGTVVSSPFTLTQPWLIVPYAGYPTAHGNGLRLRMLDSAGQDTTEEIGCPGPNHDDIEFWLVDARPHQGRKVRLVLYDGRDATDGWIAVAPPIPATEPALAETLKQRLRSERHAGTLVSLCVIALVATACGIFSHALRWRTRTVAPTQF